MNREEFVIVRKKFLGEYFLKKRIKIIVLLLVSVLLFLNITNSLADFTSIVELDYEYDVVTSEWSVQHGDLSTSSTGIFIGETNHPVGSKYAVHITSEVSHEIEYTITIGEDTVTTADTPNNYTILDLLFLPILMADLNNSWDQSLFDKGTPKIINTHFFDLSVVDPLFEYLAEVGGTMDPDPLYKTRSFTFITAFDKEDSKGIFEWSYWRDFYVPTDGEDQGWCIAGFYDLKYEYDLTTGVLNGYHICLDYNGTTEDGKIIDLFLHQHVEAVGYRMEKLFWDARIAGIEILITIPALLTVSSISLYIRKRRKKK